ncbi:MAG: endo-1,4-beta-xylanase, partial [Prevotella sp.]|nr:endo-1,4-beta-xylanase [Prevotella sp.]
MKKQLIFTALGAMLLASCADTWDRVYEGGDPQKEGYEYLADYDPLKEYVDRSKYPNFKVALAIEANDYNKQELVYALANSNFNELVTGNAMKMASCVDDKGNMSFGTVTEFINNATNAGMDVYGHTLAWHSQQPIKWLSSLIADKEMQVDPDATVDKVDYKLDCSTLTSYSWTGSPETVVTEWNKDGAVVIYNPEVIDPWYTLQYWLVNGISLEEGKTYKISIECKAEGAEEPNVRFKIGDWGGGDTRNFNIPVGGDYDVVEFNVTPTMASNGLFFQHGDFAGTIYWKSITISHSEAPSFEIFTDQVTNGSMEVGQPMDNFVVREAGKGDVPGNPIAGGPDGKNCIKITSIANPANSWDTQFFIYTPDKTWAGGEEYKISFWYKASEEAGSESQCHGEPGGYKHWAMLPENPTFTTEWQYYEKQGTIPAEGDGMKAIAFNLNVNKNQVDYYFADIHWYTIKSGNTIPLTPEEKKDTLTWAMDKWIGAMMTACEGKVKAWDVVNEAISGGNPDSEGVFALQHSEGYKPGGTWDVGGDAFYWQDYLGDLDYVRTAVASARKHFEANGGTPSDLKLFVNDYNLESDWDNNGKLKSLIAWIKRWEADGVTKIDGIGTQMHISCYMNPQIQESKKKHITQMFELMAASGKLCRVSELDMGLVDAAGNTVKTADVTEEQHKAMAEMYKFVVSEYLRIIPADQQWGICQWCATDAPASSGWRGGEPVGLWDSNYYRKHTYAGFADG